MTTSDTPGPKPLWLAIEEEIRGLGSHDLADDNVENALATVAASLDEKGLNVSRNAGSMLALRGAFAARISVGRPLLEDLGNAFAALTLEKVRNPYAATVNLIDEVGDVWPALKESQRRPQVLEMVQGVRLDLLVAKAKSLGGDTGVRLLIQEDIPPGTVVDRLGIPREDYDRVMADVEADRAERARVTAFLKDVKAKGDAEKIRHLLNNGVSDDLIVELGGVGQVAIEEMKKAMEEEIAEEKRVAEAAAARKAAEAAGPALEDIPPDEMLEHIEAIREILEFSEVEKEIRVMCDQSGIPMALVDIAISDPGRLDDLEEKAGG